MGKWLRILVKIFGALILLLILLFFLATSTIDTSPYFETQYYRNTIENIEEAVKNKTEAKGSLRAGFARINITPKMVSGIPDPKKGQFNTIKMAGYGDGKIATGVHDSLFAKAIAIDVNNESIVLINADLVAIPEDVVINVTEILKGKISRKQLFFGATHTHSSIGNCMPGYVGKSFGGEYQPEVVAWLAQKFSDLILKALADEQPAQFSSGYIKVPHLVRNRIIGESGRLNDKLDLLSFIQENGRRASIGIFSAHATVIGTDNEQYTGDYPGYFQRHLEKNGVDLAMFFAGTVGSHSNKGLGEKFDKAKYIGETLADSAQVALNKMEHSENMDLMAISSEIEIPKLQFLYISNRLRLSPYLGRKLMPKMNPVHVQGLKLNKLVWLALPYELSGEYGLDLKNALELQGYNSVLSSFNGQYLGYIVPQKYYYYDTYEARLMGWYGPSMGDYLMELNFNMANALTQTKL
ncbi:neutral/alkaline non-lysosomal ceramidase N-terminal domain-containing protein [Arenibacter sp. BSSL-BM3]|uniref:Neutral/alkaline non-lysosomal ceramidase N-terminal domain-containing protein n=1 Tax=Arenibacter arenosicollis TaxID=2762274 RepID=A0ABR7QR96_9FLAO|nr:neutral/alkaline non-lysosomal ceramidase N-terminal domain-containing protein [Arenibacter arenosicollis]MBC8769720.1 neutral/alkaline non-lysosomal ceramidase N-terminal domain-containing protein [Arenibacter arenosicollis]